MNLPTISGEQRPLIITMYLGNVCVITFCHCKSRWWLLVTIEQLDHVQELPLVGLERPVPSTSTHTTQTNWKLCIICQEDKSESLTSPSKSTRKDSGSGYSSFEANLSRFSELGQLPGTLQLERLNEGCGIEAAMVANNALYHQACKLKYNNTKLQRAEKRTFVTEGEINDAPGTEKAQEVQCFFCRHPAGTDGVHEVATFQMDSKIETGKPFLKTQNCSADSVPGTWSPRTPSTIRSVYRCCTTVLERQSPRYPNT